MTPSILWQRCWTFRFYIGTAIHSTFQRAASFASTPACRNQAFAHGSNILGLQFHPEVMAARFEHWLLGHASELATAAIDPVELRSDALANGKTLEKASVQFITEWLARFN